MDRRSTPLVVGSGQDPAKEDRLWGAAKPWGERVADHLEALLVRTPKPVGLRRCATHPVRSEEAREGAEP